MNVLTDVTAEFVSGRRPDLTPEQYHADPCPRPSLSSTIAKDLLFRSPLHAWTANPRLNPGWEPVVKDVFDIGSACHRMLLGKGAQPIRCDVDAWTTKAAREIRDEIRERGDIPLKARDYDRVVEMRRAVRAFLGLAGEGLDDVFSEPDQAEVAYLSEIDGAWCRAMVDYEGDDGFVYDLKTTTDASPQAVQRAVQSYGYHVQAAHYLDVIEAATGKRPGWRFVFVEKKPPHACAVVQLRDEPGHPADWMGVARGQVARARRRWRTLLARGTGREHWPGYPSAVMEADAPAWFSLRAAELDEALDGMEEAEKRGRADPDLLRRLMALQAPHNTQGDEEGEE